MKKNLKWIIIIASLVVALIIFLIIKSSLRVEAELTFPDTIKVENATNYEVEKIIKALTYNVFEMDTMKITVANVPKHMEQIGKINLQAYISKNPYRDNHYYIYISRRVNDVHLRKILSHEFIHLYQMENGDLLQIGQEPMAIWKGDTIDYLTVEYKKRPHEIEAAKLDDRVFKDLLDVLYE